MSDRASDRPSDAEPTWTWSFEGAEGQAVDVGAAAGADLGQPEGGFTARADAETWVGERWRALVATGAEVALLRRDDERVGGPLVLRPAV